MKLEDLRKQLREQKDLAGLPRDTIQQYLDAMRAEREYLIAAYILQTGLSADQIVWIERHDQGGVRGYPAPRDQQLDDIAPEVRRLKGQIGTLNYEVGSLREVVDAIKDALDELPSDEAWRTVIGGRKANRLFRALAKLESN
jgi:hypothetical protein